MNGHISEIPGPWHECGGRRECNPIIVTHDLDELRFGCSVSAKASLVY